MVFDKGTTFRANMQAFGARKWITGLTGDNVGEYDGV